MNHGQLLHFPGSPYSRRIRLCFAHKGMEPELIDPRSPPHEVAEVGRLYPVGTCPAWILEKGRVLGDSMAISRVLDARAPDPRLWPTDADELFEVLVIANLVDCAIEHINNLGQRYFPLRKDPMWGGVRDTYLGRAQRSLDHLADLAASKVGGTILASGWSAGDIWLFSLISWLLRMPGRAARVRSLEQTLSLGVVVPNVLTRWGATHCGRSDVRSLEAGVDTIFVWPRDMR